MGDMADGVTMEPAPNPVEVAHKQELASATVQHLNMVACHAVTLLQNLEHVIPWHVQVSVPLTLNNLYKRKSKISEPLPPLQK